MTTQHDDDWVWVQDARSADPLLAEGYWDQPGRRTADKRSLVEQGRKGTLGERVSNDGLDRRL